MFGALTKITWTIWELGMICAVRMNLLTKEFNWTECVDEASHRPTDTSITAYARRLLSTHFYFSFVLYYSSGKLHYHGPWKTVFFFSLSISHKLKREIWNQFVEGEWTVVSNSWIISLLVRSLVWRHDNIFERWICVIFSKVLFSLWDGSELCSSNSSSIHSTANRSTEIISSANDF